MTGLQSGWQVAAPTSFQPRQGAQRIDAVAVELTQVSGIHQPSDLTWPHSVSRMAYS